MAEFTQEKPWTDLNANQKAVVIAYQRHSSYKDAAEAAGVEPTTVYDWEEYPFRAALDAIEDRKAEVAISELRDAVVDAARVKTSEVREAGSTTQQQQKAASDVLNRILGKATEEREIDLHATHEVDGEQLAEAMEKITKASEKYGGDD